MVRGWKAVVGCGVLVCAGLLAGCAAEPRSDTGQLTSSYEAHPSELAVGDCISNMSELGSDVSKVMAVPCSSEHDGEIFAMTADGDTSSTDHADQFCKAAFADYVGISYDDSELDVTWFLPGTISENRTMVCVVQPNHGTVSESYQGKAI